MDEVEAAAADDPLHGLIKNLYDIYEKPVELLWDGTKFGIANVDGWVVFVSGAGLR